MEGARSPSRPSCRPRGGRARWSTGRRSGAAAISTRPSGPRCSLPRTSGWCGRARANAAGSSTRPWPSSTRRRRGRSRKWRRSSASGQPCCEGPAGSSAGGGHHARCVGSPARRRREPCWWRPVRRWSASWRRSPRPTTRGWPVQATTVVTLDYQRSWSGRPARRPGRNPGRRTSNGGVSLIGPHRDELELSLGGLPGRTHASQGEQRSLALALQLAAHQLATERLGSPPVLLLDDVFSELDPFRSKALLAGLPPGQTLLTTALPAPDEVAAAKIYPVDAGGHVVCRRGKQRRRSGSEPRRARHGPRPLETSLDAVTRQLGLRGLEGPRAPVRPLARDRRRGHGRPRAADPARRANPWW